MTVKAFILNMLAAKNESRLWFVLAVSLGVISAVSFEINAFTQPVDAINGDARMFLSWMGRWSDAGPLNGDFVADYWSAVSPWAYSALFYVAWVSGIPPVIFVKILPALLFLLVPVFSFRFIRAVRGEPIIAFLVSAAVLHYLARANLIITGTPRAFWPVFLLAMLDGLARRSVLQAALAQLLLTGTYPQMALTTATMTGLTAILDRTQFQLIMACALATVLGIVPFVLLSGGYAPSFTLAEALTIPTFGPDGRGALLPADGSSSLLCGSRLAFLVDCRGAALGKSSIIIVLALAGSVIVFLRKQRQPVTGGIASELPLILFLASVFWFTVARIMLFQFHLPNRYTAATELLIYLTILPLILEWIRRSQAFERIITNKDLNSLAVGLTILILSVCITAAVNIKKSFQYPEPQLLQALKDLPRTATVGGFVDELDFSPVLTNRSTLFSRELSIAYQKGFFLPIMGRMEAMKDLILTHDPAVFIARVDTMKLTHLVLRGEDLTKSQIPSSFRGFFDEVRLQLEETKARANPTILLKLAPSCTMGVYQNVSLIRTDCLVIGASEMSTQSFHEK